LEGTVLPKFEQFIKERQYITNVSDSTVEWYRQSLKWLNIESPTEADIKAVVMRMRDSGLKPTGCNCRLRAIKAYVRWAGIDTTIPKLKEPQQELPTFDSKDITRLMKWRPKSIPEHRLHLLISFLLDIGARIDEALSLRWVDVDFDNLLVLLHGKGGKDRRIPISLELRKRLFQYQRRVQLKVERDISSDLVFGARGGTKQGRRNVLRDVKDLCRELGFEPPARTLHAFRHTFATNYLRRGGNVFLLQRALGHSSLEMTRRYAHLQTSDLSAVHEKLSLLNC
jgi:integrase/recombinase XerD